MRVSAAVVASHLRAWANDHTHTTDTAWVGDRAAGHGPGEGDRLHEATPRRREWMSTAHGFDALGRVQPGADPHEVASHAFDNRLNALGLADWLASRRAKPDAKDKVLRLLEGAW